MAAQFACILALILILATIGLGVTRMSMPSTATIVSPIRSTAPTSAPGSYRIPSEPVDYNDPNYIGSYGG
jgi:hypothetical protein